MIVIVVRISIILGGGQSLWSPDSVFVVIEKRYGMRARLMRVVHTEEMHLHKHVVTGNSGQGFERSKGGIRGHRLQ